MILLITRLAPNVDEDKIRLLLEQCGEVEAWRIGRGPDGEQLSFGFAQYGDPESAWKASVSLQKLNIAGQEIKVMIEEEAEKYIQQWRSSQQAALKLNTVEELEWELER